jgi:predicted small secreted protein
MARTRTRNGLIGTLMLLIASLSLASCGINTIPAS